MTREVVITGGARTPMAEYVGSFKDMSAIELGAIAAVLILAEAHLHRPWDTTVYMVDASPDAGAVLATQADLADIREEDVWLRMAAGCKSLAAAPAQALPARPANIPNCPVF